MKVQKLLFSLGFVFFKAAKFVCRMPSLKIWHTSVSRQCILCVILLLLQLNNFSLAASEESACFLLLFFCDT